MYYILSYIIFASELLQSELTVAVEQRTGKVYF